MRSSHDPKEPAPINLVVKIITGIAIGLITLLLVGFTFAFEEAKSLVITIIAGSLSEVVGAIIALGVLKVFAPIIINYFLKKEAKKMLKLPKRKKRVRKKPITSIRSALKAGQQKRQNKQNN